MSRRTIKRNPPKKLMSPGRRIEPVLKVGSIGEIKCVEPPGAFRFERIDPQYYGRTRVQWRIDFGIELPAKSELYKFGDPSQLIILLKQITGTVVFKDSSYIQYQFDRGFITDLATVPKWFRGIVDNDDLKLLLAVFIHDRNFSSHDLSFRDSNILLYRMIRARDYSRIKSGLVYLSVNSLFGRKHYNRNIRRDAWTQETSRVFIPRKR